MRRAVVVAAMAVCVSAGQVAGAQPARAQDFDAWITAKDVRVNSGACREIPFTVRHDGGLLTRFAVDVEVWKGSKYVGEAFEYHYDSAGPLRGDYFWCPYEGVGKYRLGPMKVEWSAMGDPYYDSYWETWESDELDGEFTDSSKASFWVKQDHRAKVRSARKKAGRVTVTAKFRFFDASGYSWHNDPKGTRVLLQRKTASGWKKVGAGRVGSKGLVTISGKAAKGKKTYRVLQKGTKRSWSASATFKR